MARQRFRPTRRWLIVAGVLLAAVIAERSGIDLSRLDRGRLGTLGRETFVGPLEDSGGVERVARAFETRQSGFMVTLEARVERVLSDDREGSRHQRFVIGLPGGQTLLVAHNIDLAERVPLAPGDRVRLRGEYEWNDLGGVLHWTHHDPDGRRAGGWIEHAGLRFE